MSTVPPSVVYTGFWVDHSYGPVLGGTLTVTSSTANILIALLASLVSLTGIQLWNLVAFLYHLSRACKNSAGGLFYQQQVLLRNVSSPSTFAYQLGKLSWSWRKIDKHAWLKCLKPISLAVVISVGFIMAGIFSSQVVTSSNFDILISSEDCGWQDVNTEAEVAALAYRSYMSQAVASGIQFSKTCYNSTDHPEGSKFNPACSVFVHNQMPFPNISHGSCPFPGDICVDAPMLAMDTGLLNSQSFWGINCKPDDRIETRHVAQCSPLKTEGYIKEEDGEGNLHLFESLAGRKPFAGEKLILLNYGGFKTTGAKDPRIANATSLLFSAEATIKTYTLLSQSYYGDNQSPHTSFYPIPELHAMDAEIHLITVAAGNVKYYEPGNGPVFSANRAIQQFSNQGMVQAYVADEPAGIIGCTQQLQFCNPRISKCTSLNNQVAAIAEANQSLDLSPKQNVTLALLANALVMGIGDAVLTGSLLAKDTLGAGIQSPLPANQWEIEVQNWIQSTIPTMQKVMSDYAVGYGISNPTSGQGKFIVKPATAAEQQLCQSQKMKAPTGFSNINVFGFGFTVGIALFVVLLNQLLPTMLLTFWRRKQLHSRRVLCWTQDGVLQIQRKAFESLGTGEWRGHGNEVPVTLEKHKLASLSLHPDSEEPSPQGSGSDIAINQDSPVLKH